MSSELKIKLAKSMLVGVGFSNEVVQPLASIFRCEVGKLPLTYLRLLLEACMNPKQFVI